MCLKYTVKNIMQNKTLLQYKIVFCGSNNNIMIVLHIL